MNFQNKINLCGNYNFLKRLIFTNNEGHKYKNIAIKIGRK